MLLGHPNPAICIYQYGMNDNFLVHVWKSRCNEYEDLDDGGWAVPEKKKLELSASFFGTPPWNYEVFYFTHGNSRQNKVSPQLETPQN